MNELDLILLALLVAVVMNVVLLIIFWTALKDVPSTTDQSVNGKLPASSVNQMDTPEVMPYWVGWPSHYYRPYISGYIGNRYS